MYFMDKDHKMSVRLQSASEVSGVLTTKVKMFRSCGGQQTDVILLKSSSACLVVREKLYFFKKEKNSTVTFQRCSAPITQDRVVIGTTSCQTSCNKNSCCSVLCEWLTATGTLARAKAMSATNKMCVLCVHICH